MFATFSLFIANADKIQKYKTEWFSETEMLLLLTLWQRPQEHFNQHPPLWHPYTLTFDVIPYTLKTLERYFAGLIEHIRVCGPRSGISVVIRFAAKSVLQNTRYTCVSSSYTYPHPYRISVLRLIHKTSCTTSLKDHTINLSVHARKNDNSWHIWNLNIVYWGTSHFNKKKKTEPMEHIYQPPPLNKPGKMFIWLFISTPHR